MSITFRVTIQGTITIDGVEKVCYREAYPEGFSKEPTEIDPIYGPAYPENPWSFNVANDKASMLVRTLGFEFDYNFPCGTFDPTKLIAACDEALATINSIPELDAGVDWEQDGNWVECGMMTGYMRLRMTQLKDLAVIAREKGLLVGYV